MQTKPPAEPRQDDLTRLYLSQEKQPSPTIPLDTLAKVRRGYALRSKDKGESGNTILIQDKDITSGLSEPLDRVNIKKAPKHHFLQAGDIVMKMRGNLNTAMLIEAPEPATICIASLAYIRIIDPSCILPEYLEWFINSEVTQAKFEKYTRIGRGRVVTPDRLRKLGVLVPSIERQREIALTYSLNKQVASLESQLTEKRRRYAEGAMFEAAKIQ